MEFIDKSDIMKGIEPDSTADILEKAMGHKYYKREGIPGNYKYYYTEAEYRAAKGKKAEDQSSEIIEKDGKKYKLQSNGKYLEVSKHGMTKKEHERDRDYFSKRAASEGRINNKTSEENVRKHHTAASKLSDKEFTKEELEGKERGKQASSFNWDSKDAKILAKFGITKDNLVTKKWLDLTRSPITSLPEGLKVEGDLNLSETPITSLPKGLKVGGYLDLSETPITSLPEGLKVGGYLDLSETPITSLPEGLEVGESLYLSHSKITSLPEGLKVGGNLYLSHSKITSLPKGLEVGGSLSLSNTPITSLPEGLKVGGNLYLSETPITSLPKDLEVKGRIYMARR